MIKKTFEEVQEAWAQAANTSETRAQFQEKWSLILITSGWTRQEFHKALEDRA